MHQQRQKSLNFSKHVKVEVALKQCLKYYQESCFMVIEDIILHCFVSSISWTS